MVQNSKSNGNKRKPERKKSFSSWHCLFIHNEIENPNMFFNWNISNRHSALLWNGIGRLTERRGDFYLLLTLFECRFLLHFSPPRFCVIFSVSTDFFSSLSHSLLSFFNSGFGHGIQCSWRLVVTDNKINAILFFFFFHIIKKINKNRTWNLRNNYSKRVPTSDQ